MPAAADLTVSVNLTAREFADPFLVDDVQAILEDTGLAPQRLKLEILETALLDASPETVATLARLARARHRSGARRFRHRLLDARATCRSFRSTPSRSIARSSSASARTRTAASW